MLSPSPLVYPKIFLVQKRDFPKFIKISLLQMIFVRKKIRHAKSLPPFLAEIGRTQKVHAKSPPPFFSRKKSKGGGLSMKSPVYIKMSWQMSCGFTNMDKLWVRIKIQKEPLGRILNGIKVTLFIIEIPYFYKEFSCKFERDLSYKFEPDFN